MAKTLYGSGYYTHHHNTRYYALFLLYCRAVFQRAVLFLMVFAIGGESQNSRSSKTHIDAMQSYFLRKGKISQISTIHQ
jgi:hypothetical protein